MSLTIEEVQKIAHLARIELSDDETAGMQKDLDNIISYIEQLSEVNTEGIKPIANIAGLQNVTREDIPLDILERDLALSNAPMSNTEAFLVPKAVER